MMTLLAQKTRTLLYTQRHPKFESYGFRNKYIYMFWDVSFFHRTLVKVYNPFKILISVNHVLVKPNNNLYPSIIFKILVWRIMFWTEFGTANHIERASLDGNNRTIILNSVGGLNGLAIDFEDNRWVMNPTSNPHRTHTEPSPNPHRTHTEPTPNPHRTLTEPTNSAKLHHCVEEWEWKWPLIRTVLDLELDYLSDPVRTFLFWLFRRSLTIDLSSLVHNLWPLLFRLYYADRGSGSIQHIDFNGLGRTLLYTRTGAEFFDIDIHKVKIKHPFHHYWTFTCIHGFSDTVSNKLN